jgi:hypothetical protein
MRSQQGLTTNIFTKFIVARLLWLLRQSSRIESNLPWLVSLKAVGDGLRYVIHEVDQLW